MSAWLSTWWHELQAAMHELSEACAVDQASCEAYQEPAFVGLWPVLLPIVLAVGAVGLVIQAVAVRRGDK